MGFGKALKKVKKATKKAKKVTKKVNKYAKKVNKVIDHPLTQSVAAIIPAGVGTMVLGAADVATEATIIGSDKATDVLDFTGDTLETLENDETTSISEVVNGVVTPITEAVTGISNTVGSPIQESFFVKLIRMIFGG